MKDMKIHPILDNQRAAVEDKLLASFFELDRWEHALKKGSDKGMSPEVLRKLSTIEGRKALYRAIRDHEYHIAMPREQRIPKDTPGEYRNVYINSDEDRIVLSIANDLLLDKMSDRIHPSCKSYQPGIGCGKVVKEVSKAIADKFGSEESGKVIGWKSDLSKYFDSVKIEYIDKAFDEVEERYGKSALIDLLREYYHSEEYINHEGNLTREYKSLKQGCAVSAYLANAVLHEVDEALYGLKGYYVRYSDDMLYIGEDYEEAKSLMDVKLSEAGLRKNDKKFKYLTDNKWFNFLGFSIRGGSISISPHQVETFSHEIHERVFRRVSSQGGEGGKRHQVKNPLRRVLKYLYVGDGEHSWATRILNCINSQKDIDTLNTYILDCLRASETGRRKLGGLQYSSGQAGGCIVRTKGRHVTSNRRKTVREIEGYMSLTCMRKALLSSRPVYEALVRGI